MDKQHNNPLHGITLEALLTELVDGLGWQKMAQAVDINCFKSEPSVKSSLKFLRRTPWARTKVEELYVDYVADKNRGHSPVAFNPWLAGRN
jgi:uncharacterized protein (DUF2132 family)